MRTLRRYVVVGLTVVPLVLIGVHSAQSLEYPIKGRTITILCQSSPGASADLGARLLAVAMEKELGTPVQVVNKPGAGGQVAITEQVKSKSDGYTLLQQVLPTAILMYLDPSRGAVFARKDFELIGNYSIVATAIAVKSDARFKTLKDLIEAARAKPDTIKIGDPGLMTGPQMTVVLLEKVAGVKFASVRFDGGGKSINALLGGHIDATSSALGSYGPLWKGGVLRILGLADTMQDKLYPGVKTMAEQGYNVSMPIAFGLVATTGTPKEVVDILKQAFKKSVETPEFRTKLEESGSSWRYQDPEQFNAFWADMEGQLKPLMSLSK